MEQRMEQAMEQKIEKMIDRGPIDERLADLYGSDAVEAQKTRCRDAVRRFAELFAELFEDDADGSSALDCSTPGCSTPGCNADRRSASEGRAPEYDALEYSAPADSTPKRNAPTLHLFRAPGRTEIGGNHTDHQHGQVLAAAIDKDMLAVVGVPAAADGMIRLYSEGFGWTEADLSAWTSGGPDPAETGTAKALIHGMVDGMLLRGYKAGGFYAYVTSDVPEGSGLSSSAAFEVLIGTILNELFNGGSVPAEEIARMAQAAENRYYGKPCGLMDQMVCAMGGLCHIDFRDPDAPIVKKMDADLAALGYSICITNTHGSHADHTDDYVAVQTDLAAAAGVFGKTVLEGVSQEEVIAHARQIREAGGDRAFLRALHVAAENERVEREALALEQKKAPAFLDLVRQSGDSSYKYLQNVHASRTPDRQELAVALAISEAVLRCEAKAKDAGCGVSGMPPAGTSDMPPAGVSGMPPAGTADIPHAGTSDIPSAGCPGAASALGACRVHGGGFAGTIQAFVPESLVGPYRRAMDEAFGEGSCFVIRICPEGGAQLL